LTTGNVVVHLFLDEAVKAIGGDWVKITDTYFTKIFASNTSEVVQFVDMAGNVNSTGIVIDWIEVPEQNYGANGDYQIFVAPQD
jgi:hypothetical protein